MTLVKYINAVFRGRQYRSPAEGQVRQGQVVIGNDDIGVLQLVTARKKLHWLILGQLRPLHWL